MVASSGDETGQNAILGKLKGAAAGSSDLKATEIAPPKIRGKFDKVAKRESKSPSLDRQTNLCDEEAVNAAAPTPGHTQAAAEAEASLTQAMEIQLENDKQKHDDFINNKEEDTEERDYVKRQLEKEKEKRRDVEDSVDMLRREQAGQRDDICKTMHVVKKMATASLQDAEKDDGVTVFVIKKKTQNTRGFFEAYKNLQKMVADNNKLVSSANVGPLVTVKVAGPDFVRQALDLIKDWAKREAVEAAIFRGKNSLTQMMELPIRASFNALVKISGGGNTQVAREAGLTTNWPDLEKKWSISMGANVLVRGLVDLDNLQANVDINLDGMDEAAAKQVKDSIRHYESTDRFGSLFEVHIKNIPKFGGGSNWGRVRKGGGKGKGKGF